MINVTTYFNTNCYYHIPTGYVFYHSPTSNKYNFVGVDQHFVNEQVYDKKMKTAFTNFISNVTTVNVVWPDKDHTIYRGLQTCLLNTKTQEILHFGYDKASSFIIGKNIVHNGENYAMPAPLYMTKRNTNKVKVFSCPRSIRSKICFHHLNDPVIFELPDSCFYGRNLEIIKQSRNGFYNCCENNYLDAAKLLYGFDGITYDLSRAFDDACSNGSIDCAEWLLKLREKQMFELHDLERLFVNSGFLGSIAIGKLLLELNSNLKSDSTTWATLCKNGKLEFVQWFYRTCGPVLHYSNDLPFRLAAVDGNLSVAKFLYECGQVDITANSHEAHRGSFINGHNETYDWLNSLLFFEVTDTTDKIYSVKMPVWYTFA